MPPSSLATHRNALLEEQQPQGIRSYVDRTFDPAATVEKWTESVRQM